jgi:DNA-binding FadR family transcriptional regulator
MSSNTLQQQHPMAARIVEFLSEAQLEGNRLPAERDLARSLGVTRAGLRAGLDQLEAEGVLWRHVGKGTFFGRRPEETQNSFSELRKTISPQNLLEVRMLLEPQIVALAAMRASGEELDELEGYMVRAGAALSVAEYEIWDDQFHRCLVHMSKNALLIKMFEFMDSVKDARVWGQLKEHCSSPERRLAYSGQHELIVRALVECRPAEAKQAMEAHLQEIQRDLLSGR